MKLPCYLCGKTTDNNGHCEQCKITTVLDRQPLRYEFSEEKERDDSDREFMSSQEIWRDYKERMTDE